MGNLTVVEREMTESEYAQVVDGFNAYAQEHGNPREVSERYGLVAMDGEDLVGCSSGIVYRKTDGYSNWFYLTDLFIEKDHRGKGLGSELLRKLEEKAAALGVGRIWTWTAGYEAPDFYQKQGYTIFCEMDNWYSSGHSRIGLKKTLLP